MDNPLFLFCPFPTVHSDGTLCNGLLLKQSTVCAKKCAAHVCKHFLSGKEESVPKFYTCPSGYSVAVVRIGDSIIRINGVIETSSNSSKARFKKQNKDRKFKSPELEAWISAFKSVQPEYNTAIESKAKDAVHALHDIKSLIGSIMKTSEEWITEQVGYSIDEQIENSPEPLRKIYQSCRLLESLLLTTDILVNPKVAKFGKSRLISINNVLFLLIKIHEDKAQSSGKTIYLKGYSSRSALLYGSFIVIPHILIDNAIKHSDPNTEIHIFSNDLDNGDIIVKISSFGRLIPQQEENEIFQRGVRGSNTNVRGSGLGLYIAQLVAKANGFNIHYKSTKVRTTDGKGYNSFYFRIRGGSR